MLDLTAEDMEALIRAGAGLNPEYAPLLEAFALTAAEGTRLIALHPNPQAIRAGYVANINLMSSGNLGLPLDFMLESAALSLEGTIPGAKLTSRETIDDLNGVPAGRIEMRMPVTTVYGTQIRARSTIIMVVASGQVLQLVLSSEEGLHSQYKQPFEDTIRSLTVVTP